MLFGITRGDGGEIIVSCGSSLPGQQNLGESCTLPTTARCLSLRRRQTSGIRHDHSEGFRLDYDRKQLIELVKQEALQFGDFTLASGKRASYYLD